MPLPLITLPSIPRKPLRQLACLGWALLLAASAWAQRTRVSGTVTDATTGTPVPFANVVFTGTTVGTLTDTLGRYSLGTDRRVDSLRVMLLGYHPATLPVIPGTTEVIEVQLVPLAYELDLFTVRPGENPAFAVLRKAIANKPINTPERLEHYGYTVYHRVRFDLNNFTDDIKRNILLRPFDYIWDDTRTTADSVRYLPIVLTERIEEHHYRRTPPAHREVVKGRRAVKFFRAPRIMEFVEDMYVDPDLYANHVVILDKSFPSPLNDYYRRNYDFLLLDSGVVVNERPCYHLSFKPKGRADVAFTGEIFLDSATHALVRADVAFSIEANINFVRNYWIRQDYELIDGTQWFRTRSQVLADFTVVENVKEMTGFFGRKTSEFRAISLDPPRDADLFSGVDPVVFEDGADARDEAFWEAARGDTLGDEELRLVAMVDRMNNDPRWRRLVNISKMLSGGWLPAGKVDIGNVFTFFTRSAEEGPRVKFGLRTNEDFSRGLRLAGHLAYGFRDLRFKHGLAGAYRFPIAQGKRWEVGLRQRNDVWQQGRSDNMIPVDHVLGSLLRITGQDRRMLVDDREGYVERQWFTGLTARATMFQQRLDAMGFDLLQRTGDGDTLVMGGLLHSGVRVNVRFAWGDTDLPATFTEVDRGLFLLDHPVISLEGAWSFRDLWGGQYDRSAYRIKVEHQVRTGKWGFFGALVEAGLIVGELPFPLLHVPDGNPLLLNDDHAFNLMNYLEFATDRYVSLHLEHHFEGLLLNKVPLLRRLKLRELLVGGLYYGTLSPVHAQAGYLPASGMRTLDAPYTEVGFGIENILKIARVDFTWRVGYLDQPGVIPFVVKPSFYFRF